MKRGMTLLEVLLALALLASLVVAITSWTTMSAAFAARIEHTLEQESSAEAFLRFVHDSLAAGDFADSKDAEEQPRVFIDDADGALVVRTRAQGAPAVHRFTFDAETMQLRLDEQVLAAEVADANWTMNDEQHTLSIDLSLGSGEARRRRYVLP